MHGTTDAQLVAQARSGDKGAFGHLIERHQRMAERVAMGVVAHRELARDLAQEGLLQAYLSLDRLRDAERFQSWLYGIVLNVCRSHLSDQKADLLSLEALAGGVHYEALPLGAIEPGPQEVAEARELHTAVLRAVQGLSPKNRAATLLFYYEQLSVREVAATLGISVAAAKGRLHKARSQLRELLLPVIAEPTHAEPRPQEEGTMLEVTVADVIGGERKDEKTGGSFTMTVVLLVGEDMRRVLPIWMGQPEGNAIALGLTGLQTPRPLTFDFMARVVEAAGAELEEVRVESLKNDTFYAVAKFRRGEAVHEVDARPSDAMALAVCTERPIYVADEVMERAGKDIPEDVTRKHPLGTALASLKVDGLNLAVGPGQHVAPDFEKARERWEEASQEVFSFLFGSESEDDDTSGHSTQT